MNKAIQNDLNSQSEKIKSQVTNMENVKRLIGNTVAILSEVEVKGAYAKPLTEIFQWLEGFDASVKAQIQALQSLLPKDAPKPDVKPDVKPIDIAVAPADATVPQDDAAVAVAPSEAK